MTYFEVREIYDLHGRLLASCTSNEAAAAAMRLLGSPGSEAKLTVVGVDRNAGVITYSERDVSIPGDPWSS